MGVIKDKSRIGDIKEKQSTHTKRYKNKKAVKKKK